MSETNPVQGGAAAAPASSQSALTSTLAANAASIAAASGSAAPVLPFPAPPGWKPRASRFPPFPQSAWRGLFQLYADLVAPTTEASEAAIWGAHAASLSILLGRDCWIEWGSGAMFPTIHVAILGPTGAGRKSASIDDAQNVLIDPFKPKPQNPGEPDPLVVLNGMGSGEGFIEAIRDTAYWPPGASKRTTPPVVQIGRRALFIIPELGGLLEKANAGAAGSMVDFIINAFDCKREWTHQIRKTQHTEPFKATNATAVVLAASTVEWLSETLNVGHVRNGLVNRFLWLAGDPRAPISMRPRLDPVKLHTYQQAVMYALASVRGQQFQVDPGAFAVHDAYYRKAYMSRLDINHDDVAISATNRAEIQALRMCIILAAAEAKTTIDRDIMETAWALTRYSGEVVNLVAGGIRARNFNEFETRVIKAAKKAGHKKGGRFTRRDVWDRCKGTYGIASVDFGKVWDGLVLEGDLTMVSAGDRGGAGGGASAAMFRLSNTALEVLDAGLDDE